MPGESVKMKLKDIGEFGFIERITNLGLIRPEGVLKGIGDDCAVISQNDGSCLLVTTDLLVERVHFMTDWGPAEWLGEKALAVNLSDIAACGGAPRDAFVSLAIPDRIDVEWLDGFYSGLMKLAHAHGVNVLGGDTTGSKTDLVINLAVTGVVARDELLLRSTARADDVIALTGPTGMSAAGLTILINSLELSDHMALPLIRSHLRPRPHLKEGRFLASSQACSAAIDVSDGLVSDLAHICEESGVGALIYETDIPVEDTLFKAAQWGGSDVMDWVLNGGEDYVLLVALSHQESSMVIQRASEAGIDLVPIGKFVQTGKIQMVRLDGTIEDVRPRGWDHFR